MSNVSFGFGDRLGLAGEGHVRAWQKAGRGIYPIFAQQSARELSRTGRTPRSVMLAARRAAGGVKVIWGNDADHIVNREQAAQFAAAGFLRFTLDATNGLRFIPDLAEYLSVFEFELAIDETPAPTTFLEHLRAAAILRVNGITIDALAPNLGFQKAVDYTGSLTTLRKQLSGHALIARLFGYRLSIHSGSDKFRAYPVIMQATRKCGVHIKTSGASWIVALGVVADCAPDLWLKVSNTVETAYPQARRGYHVFGQSRQKLHVTYGDVLAAYGREIRACLERNADEYTARIERYFITHLEALQPCQPS